MEIINRDEILGYDEFKDVFFSHLDDLIFTKSFMNDYSEEVENSIKGCYDSYVKYTSDIRFLAKDFEKFIISFFYI